MEIYFLVDTKRFHFTLTDGKEMIEEYNIKTDCILSMKKNMILFFNIYLFIYLFAFFILELYLVNYYVNILARKWRVKGQLGGEGKWEYEIGDLPKPVSEIEMAESNTNVSFCFNK